MKKFWEQLKPQERRWLIAIACIVFVTMNYFFVWPQFKQWRINANRIQTDTDKMATYRTEIAHKAEYQSKISGIDPEDQNIAQEDQVANFENFFRDRAIENGVQIQSVSRPTTSTYDFTIERQATIQVLANEKSLVGFLYSLGASGSTMRVRAMSLRPLDMNRYQLHADLTLVESYLRNPATQARGGAAAGAAPGAAPKPGQPPAKPGQPGAPAVGPTTKFGTLNH